MKVFEKFEKWEKLWQDGKNEYLRKSHISTEILRTILLKGQKGKTLYRIIDSDDRLFYEGIVNLRITCTTSDIDKLMYISNGVGRKSVAVVEFSKDTLSYEMQKTDSKWTDESEHLTFGKFKVSKKSDEIYIKNCDIPLVHLYAEPIDQSVDFAKKLIQKRIGHYKEDPLAKRLNDEAILKMFNESTNYNMPKRKENIDIDYYESQPTDTDKLRQWASSHKFAENKNLNSKYLFEKILYETKCSSEKLSNFYFNELVKNNSEADYKQRYAFYSFDLSYDNNYYSDYKKYYSDNELSKWEQEVDDEYNNASEEEKEFLKEEAAVLYNVKVQQKNPGDYYALERLYKLDYDSYKSTIQDWYYNWGLGN
jgi:hypothetical protein